MTHQSDQAAALGAGRRAKDSQTIRAGQPGRRLVLVIWVLLAMSREATPISIANCSADETKLNGNQCRCPAGSFAHCDSTACTLCSFLTRNCVLALQIL